jgi:hypothetical protein
LEVCAVTKPSVLRRAFILCLAAAPLCASAASPPPTVFGGGMGAATGEERVLLHGEHATITYCVNPIRYDQLQLQSTTTYTAGTDVAAFFQQHIPGAAAAAAANPGAGTTVATTNAATDAQRVAAFGRTPLKNRRNLVPVPVNLDDEVDKLQQAALSELAAWIVGYQAPVLRLSAASQQTSRLVAFADLALSRVADETGCTKVANLLEGSTGDPEMPTASQNEDGIISAYRVPLPAQPAPPAPPVPRVDVIGSGGIAAAVTAHATLRDWVEHLVHDDPARTCWARATTVLATAVTAECALGVTIPSDFEAQQHVAALNALQASLTALTSVRGTTAKDDWAMWNKGVNKTRYDALVAQITDTVAKWTAVKTDTKGRDAVESARKDLQPWAARLSAIAALTTSTAGDPYKVQTEVSCAGRLTRGKSTKVVLSGSDATDPKSPPLAQEIVTIVCPSDGSTSYGIGVASRPERHFIVAQGRNTTAGATTSQSVVDTDVTGQQVPQIGYLGHLSFAGGNGNEFHVTAGPTFSFADGTNPGLFYGASYSQNRAGYISAGWLLSRVQQLSGGYSLGDTVTPDVKTPPTRQSWKNAFTVMFTFPVHTAGNDPQAPPLAKCPKGQSNDTSSAGNGNNGNGNAKKPANGSAQDQLHCVPDVPPGGLNPAPTPVPTPTPPPPRAQGANPNAPPNADAAAKATAAARKVTTPKPLR